MRDEFFANAILESTVDYLKLSVNVLRARGMIAEEVWSLIENVD